MDVETEAGLAALQGFFCHVNVSLQDGESHHCGRGVGGL